MMITIPTSEGQISFLLNGSLLKVCGLALLILATMAGYAVIQLVNFILAVTPEQLSHLFAFVLLVGVACLVRCVVLKHGGSK